MFLTWAVVVKYVSSSSSVGATARCGLWPVEQYLSICPYLSPTLSVTPSTWRSLSTSSLHLFLGLPLRLFPSSSWVKIFLGILSSSILSRWPSQLILCPFIHFTIFFTLFNSSSSRFVLIFHSPSSYLGPYILLNVFLSKLSRALKYVCFHLLIVTKIFTLFIKINVKIMLKRLKWDKKYFFSYLKETVHCWGRHGYFAPETKK